MDVNALYDRAMSMWQDSSRQEPEDAPEDVSQDADETDVSATVAGVSSDDPAEVPSNEELPSDPVEIMQDAELSDEQQDTPDEQSLLQEMTPPDLLDAMTEQDSYEQQAEPDLPFDPQSFPADPLDAMEDQGIPADQPIRTHVHETPQEANASYDADYSPRTEMLPHENGPVPYTTQQKELSATTVSESWHKPQPDNWPGGMMNGISEMLQPQFSELRYVMQSYLQEGIERQTLITDALGLEQY